MCGIAGFYTRENLDFESTVARMNAMLEHRGPNQSGSWIDRDVGIGLGHTRLAILDLSSAGAQPMISASGRYVLVYNGEVYNYGELKASLKHDSIRWRGTSDTEVILALFDRYGVLETLPRLNAMFAFGVWDRAEENLYLARDRFGEKPLYYGWSNGMFAFSSEPCAIVSSEQFDDAIDEKSLSLMLTYSYIPAPYTAYRNLYKLPPATVLTLPLNKLTDRPNDFIPYVQRGMKSRVISPRHYWDLRAVAQNGLDNPFKGSFADACSELEHLLKDAVRIRMISDVPLGAFLSGGIDSSLIVSLMCQESTSSVRTFSIGFSESEYNEAHHALRVAHHLKTQHHELTVTYKDAIDAIPTLAGMYDEPFADSSQLPTFLLSKLAREHVTVALSGDGGDELFSGYKRYFWARDFSKMLKFPRPLRELTSRALKCLSPHQWENLFGKVVNQRSRLGHRIHRFADILDCSSEQELHHMLITHWSNGEIADAGDYFETCPYMNKEYWLENASVCRRLMYLDQETYLPFDILPKVDRATMAVSLEGRMPLLDPRVAEFAWHLKDEFLYQGSSGKRILKAILEKYVPKNLFERPKMGFGVPIEHWLRNELRYWCEELLSEASLKEIGFINPKLIRKRWTEFLSMARPWDQLIWDVLCIQSWQQSRKNKRLKGGVSYNLHVH